MIRMHWLQFQKTIFLNLAKGKGNDSIVRSGWSIIICSFQTENWEMQNEGLLIGGCVFFISAPVVSSDKRATEDIGV